MRRFWALYHSDDTSLNQIVNIHLNSFFTLNSQESYVEVKSRAAGGRAANRNGWLGYELVPGPSG